jgi:two-component sensor histidine kinase/PAS domain-containing protein
MASGTPVWFAPTAAAARRLAGPASAVIFVLFATGVRLGLAAPIRGLTVFSIYYPAILGAALVGGELSAALALVLSFALSWPVMRSGVGPMQSGSAFAVNMALFVFTGAFVGAVGARLRRLLMRRGSDIERLADRQARYRALFEGVSEGFALVEGVRDETGRLIDLLVVEANPAILRIFSIEEPVVGRRQSELVPIPRADFLPACERALRGERISIEVFGEIRRRWFEVRLSRAGENRLAQIVVDITERKAAENRQTEMFDELNHRVKNNLAAVSSMLSMQARLASPQVREQLQKAVDRIQAIGDVHASLYQEGSADEVDLGAYIRRLGERLAATVVDGERIRLEVAAESVTASLDEAVALGLIVNELVTNAAKHAYPPPASGVIRVRLERTPDGLALSVRDEGPGLSKVADGRGIGMRLVRSLAQQCRADLEISDGHGANFTVRLRDRGSHPSEATQSRLL